ncbi:hypothetical protein Naga_101560g1, partial [Nannochloropsis gaditana]
MFSRLHDRVKEALVEESASEYEDALEEGAEEEEGWEEQSWTIQGKLASTGSDHPPWTSSPVATGVTPGKKSDGWGGGWGEACRAAENPKSPSMERGIERKRGRWRGVERLVPAFDDPSRKSPLSVAVVNVVATVVG